MKRRTAKILKWLGIVSIVLAVGYAILAISANRSLGRAYAALKADGRPLVLEDIVPAEIPGSDNAALVYRQVVLRLKAEKANGAGEESLWDALAGVTEKVISGRPDAETVVRLKQLYQRPAVAKALADLEAGSRKPGYWNDLDLTKGTELEIPHVLELMTLSRIVCASARLQSAAGDDGAAWDSALTALRLAQALEREPLLISQLVRAAQFEMATDTIQDLPYRALAQREADALLSAAESQAPWVAAIDSERIVFGEYVFEIAGSARGKSMISNLQGLSGSQEKLSEFRLFLYRLIGPLTTFDHAAHMTLMHDYARELSEPSSPVDSESSREPLEDLPWHCVITRMVAPTIGGIKERQVEMVAKTRVARAGLALLQRREETGALPEALPESLDLTDPFTGEPLVYIPTSKGFVLYSVGKNLLDDHGTKGEEGKGDIVWRYSEDADGSWGAGAEDSIWGAAAQGDIAAIERHLAAGTDIDARDPLGGTPLIGASVHGHFETVKWLLEKGAEIDAASQYGDTALHGAAFLCRSEVTELLIEKGADANHRNKRGETPLDTVTRKWNQSLRDLYVGLGAIFQIELDFDRIERVRPEVAELIRKNGGEQNPDLDVFTAAATGHIAIVEKYLAAGNDIEAKGPLGCRLLFHAAALGQTDIVKLLIEKGAELDAQDGEWPTALSMAADLCQREVVELLLEKGADPSLKVTAGGGVPGKQTALESVSEPWTEAMAGGYLALGALFQHPFDLERIERDRPEIAKLLRQTGGEQ